jgi:nicotinate-nucleotide pyrophosphorylase (carboxylating)
MFPFPTYENLRDLIQLAKREDLGGDDVTSRLMIPEDAIGVGTIVQKSVGVACGLPIVEMVCRTYDERLRVEMIPGFHLEVIEGLYSDAQRMPLLRLRGPLRSLLSAERVILNFLQRREHPPKFTTRVKPFPAIACSTNTPSVAAADLIIASACMMACSSKTITSPRFRSRICRRN